MSNYFSKIPNFEYVSRLPNAKISDYIRVKNLFKRGKLRDDIFENLAVFEKYSIVGNDRPDNVAYEVYDDPNLDWVVLLSNNIINIQTEWPLSQNEFDTYILEKYKDYETVYGGIHHYESKEVKNSKNVTIFPAGLIVDENFRMSYYDSKLKQQIDTGIISTPITNYEYEENINNQKRNIFILKPTYLNIVVNDLEEIVKYKKGSSQYVSEDLIRGDNIRLYN